MSTRLPVPGEQGWQGFGGGWFDVDVLAGPFYSPLDYLNGTGYFLLSEPESYPIYQLGADDATGWLPVSNMRRRPEQKDKETNGTSFEELLDECRGAEMEKECLTT